MSKQKKVDVSVSNHGTVFLFALLTDHAREWVSENVDTEGWQFLGGSLAVEPRMAWNLAEGMKRAGLELK